jgi:hypothetical protein
MLRRWMSSAAFPGSNETGGSPRISTTTQQPWPASLPSSLSRRLARGLGRSPCCTATKVGKSDCEGTFAGAFRQRRGCADSGRSPDDGQPSQIDPGCAKTRAFNLRVESSSQFGLSENQRCWRRLSEEGNKENGSTLSWLVHVFTRPGPFGGIRTRYWVKFCVPKSLTRVCHRELYSRHRDK